MKLMHAWSWYALPCHGKGALSSQVVEALDGGKSQLIVRNEQNMFYLNDSNSVWRSDSRSAVSKIASACFLRLILVFLFCHSFIRSLHFISFHFILFPFVFSLISFQFHFNALFHSFFHAFNFTSVSFECPFNFNPFGFISFHFIFIFISFHFISLSHSLHSFTQVISSVTLMTWNDFFLYVPISL